MIGVCTFASSMECKVPGGDAIIAGDPLHVTSVCKEMLEAAKKSLADTPNSMIVLVGNRNPSETKLAATSRASNVRKQLAGMGVDSSKVRVEVGTGDTRTVEIYLRPLAPPSVN